MSKILKQFRYYGENNKKNNPLGLTKNQLVSGSAFILQDNESAPIISLGIQGIPGLKFYLNEAADAVIIGNSGIYQLELNDNYEINKLGFDDKNLEDLINNPTNTAYLIIDIIYEVEE